ncbi:MAG: hypothetical protein WBB45_14755 [Cyclobacteriaceae bacterium]
MKKLSIEKLEVVSFTTENKKSFKGGGPTEHQIACPPTEALRSCYRPCNSDYAGCESIYICEA